jgi:hypothetical protein
MTNQVDRGHDHGGASAPRVPAGGSAEQKHAITAAKEARIKNAGLGGNRTGEVSATVKRAQAARDAVTQTPADTGEPAQTSPETNHPQDHAIQIQVNTDHNIHGGKELHAFVRDAVNGSLGRFGNQVTRVEVYLRDDNDSKSHGDDKRCVLEARPAGHQPLVVTHVDATLDEAVEGAVDMMERLLDRTFEKLYDPKGNTSLGEDMRP